MADNLTKIKSSPFRNAVNFVERLEFSGALDFSKHFETFSTQGTTNTNYIILAILCDRFWDCERVTPSKVVGDL